MIVFDRVTKKYPNAQEALNEVSFTVETGEMIFLTGHSGAGKSTLLKLTAAIEKPTQGQILLDGKNINKLTARQIPYIRRSMGIIFQNPLLLEDRTVFDNVALALEISGYRSQDIPKRVRAALDKVGLLKKEKLFPQALSSGEQQRLGIARAIVHKPTLLLADEPTGNLDPDLSAEIMRLFEQFNQVGVTVLIASHDLGLIARLKKPILTLKEGRLLE
ncbi:MAG: cell division ATP-binding protein FtsE [Proteobacteria bacterium]|nr:cell division ATP-binding protein FtsE [Pseudomonadota bacterium]